ncbi:hypothetical protein [Nonomuraea dietziae]|uniref:hypothetical protein n=1 Tax=Nonomuraea dietziae TaxID=65515 RepID=UPI0031E0C6C7
MACAQSAYFFSPPALREEPVDCVPPVGAPLPLPEPVVPVPVSGGVAPVPGGVPPLPGVAPVPGGVVPVPGCVVPVPGGVEAGPGGVVPVPGGTVPVPGSVAGEDGAGEVGPEAPSIARTSSSAFSLVKPAMLRLSPLMVWATVGAASTVALSF